MAGTVFDARLGSGTHIDIPAALEEMTSKREMRRFLRDHGWSRHQRGHVWRAPDGSFHGLADAYSIAMNSVSEPPAGPTDGPAGMPAKP
jgi:hypothetical protein